MKYTKLFLLFLASINVGIILAFWLLASGAELRFSVAGTIIAFGRLSGLLTVYFVLLQFLLRGRISLLEKTYGFELLNSLHIKNGYVIFSFLFLHPILLTIGYSMAGRKNVLAQFFLFLFTYEDVMKAFLGWLLFMGVIGTSIYLVRSKLRYELWYFIHLGTYIAILFAWSHQVQVGTDFSTNKWFVFYWYVLYGLTFIFLAYFRFFVISATFLKYRFKVDRIIDETKDSFSIYIKGRNLNSYTFEPGQFAFLRFLTKDFWWESHPFSYSTIANGAYLRFTIKKDGDFTEKIRNVLPDTPVSIDGPHGSFTEEYMQKKKILFIAGGVGITPIRTLIEKIGNTKNIVLFYANQTSKDIIFKKELEKIANKYQFPLHYVISREEQYDGIKGRINLQLLEQFISNIHSYEIYICGPIQMAKNLSSELISTGVPKNQIHYEDFSL